MLNTKSENTAQQKHLTEKKDELIQQVKLRRKLVNKHMITSKLNLCFCHSPTQHQNKVVGWTTQTNPAKV
jgi:hypothetical protein